MNKRQPGDFYYFPDDFLYDIAKTMNFQKLIEMIYQRVKEDVRYGVIDWDVVFNEEKNRIEVETWRS